MCVECVLNVCLKQGAPAAASPNPGLTSAGQYNIKAGLYTCGDLICAPHGPQAWPQGPLAQKARNSYGGAFPKHET